MDILGKSIRVPTILIISILLVVLLGVSLYLYLQLDSSNKISGLSGNLAIGLAVALIQLGLAYSDYSNNAELRKLELKEILYDRDAKLLVGMSVTLVQFLWTTHEEKVLLPK